MTAYTRKELHDKRAKLVREIIQLETRARELRADLAYIETAIRFLWPGEELPKVVLRRGERRPHHFKRGALTKLILDYMREHAGEVVSVADMMPLVAEGRTLNLAEYQRAAVGVYGALRRAETKQLIERTGEGWKAATWRLAAEH
jgi:hypothetical protein